MTGLLAELSRLLYLAEGLAWAATLVFVRVGAMVALMPGLGDPVVPQRIKLALVAAFAIVLSPVLADRLASGMPDPTFVALGSEAVSGLILGVGLRLFLVALTTAAAIIAQATTLSQLFAGAAPEPQPAIGNLLTMAGIALAMISGLHVRAAELLMLSYDFLPAARLPLSSDAADWSVALIGRCFSLAFTLSAPFVIASLLYNLALGAINRAMPTLMVSMVGAPALTLGGMAMLAVAAPAILMVWLAALSDHMAAPFGAVP
ncbi:flagellar biosynthetic protein FliR [Tabrizicola flagellatus]|uniref:flagellar biosynthetic protein FliR n=1 Tax=Tabrizicola flagellatus TaxID=2593021 RepID=UPI0011F18EF0|nr:flagellar biosynthetic protein FliR [Tabrizicola flagellatus]